MKTEYLKNENKERLMCRLNERLVSCMTKNKPVTIHLQTSKVTTRMTVIPEEVNFNKEGLCLEYKSYVLSIESKINHIQYVDTCEYNGYYIKLDTANIFFDFIWILLCKYNKNILKHSTRWSSGVHINETSYNYIIIKGDVTMDNYFQ